MGWRHWDPLDLNDAKLFIEQHAKWPDDEYDTYLLRAAGMLWNGENEHLVVNYLVTVEVDDMGLTRTSSPRDRATRTVSEIADYVRLLRKR